MIPGIKWQELTVLAIKAALEAGNEILDVYWHTDLNVVYKPDNSPLTIADKRAHEAICRLLAPAGLPILSEEGEIPDYSVRKNWKRFWLVDPLDGTKEFIRRNNEFTVNIALVEDSSPVAGVVYVPVAGTLYWGDSDGSYRALYDNEGKQFSDIVQLPIRLDKQSYVIAGSRSHMNAETDTFIRSVDTKGKPLEIKSRGSSLKICMVAEGEADLYPRLSPTMEWDTAAGHAIVKFAGKNLLLFDSKEPLTYNRRDLVNPWFIVE
jgi:3'(2'), 5'-bisphosphate nucleotidase